jgi:3-deoxy-D-manno-oct-2-ulosonic acid (Kdo) hydroxylase
MPPLEIFSIADWQGPFAGATVASAISSLELGKILYFPELSYTLEWSPASLLSPHLAASRAKNISFDAASGVLKGTRATSEERLALQKMMAAFSMATTRFVRELLPLYAGRIEPARASYRPIEIAGRRYSPLNDDRLLHIDAFPSTPTHGRRILRLFSNANPDGRPRVWHVGEPFADFAQKFLPTLRRRKVPVSWLLAVTGATRSRRSAYDQMMLDLHDSVKRNAAYQKYAPQQEIVFPAGSSWLCFTDQVLHAAISGQYAFEQTFYVDLNAMADPARSPIRTIERLTRRQLS